MSCVLIILDSKWGSNSTFFVNLGVVWWSLLAHNNWTSFDNWVVSLFCGLYSLRVSELRLGDAVEGATACLSCKSLIVIFSYLRKTRLRRKQLARWFFIVFFRNGFVWRYWAIVVSLEIVLRLALPCCILVLILIWTFVVFMDNVLVGLVSYSLFLSDRRRYLWNSVFWLIHLGRFTFLLVLKLCWKVLSCTVLTSMMGFVLPICVLKSSLIGHWSRFIYIHHQVRWQVQVIIFVNVVAVLLPTYYLIMLAFVLLRLSLLSCFNLVIWWGLGRFYLLEWIWLILVICTSFASIVLKDAWGGRMVFVEDCAVELFVCVAGLFQPLMLSIEHLAWVSRALTLRYTVTTGLLLV